MALRGNIRVIPALIQDTPMPRTTDLPEDLKTLTRRNALEISDTHFHRDVDQLIVVLDRVLRLATAGTPQTETRGPTPPDHAVRSATPLCALGLKDDSSDKPTPRSGQRCSTAVVGNRILDHSPGGGPVRVWRNCIGGVRHRKASLLPLSDHLFYPAGVGSDIQAKGLRHSFIPLSVKCAVSVVAKAEDLRTETRSRRWEAGHLSLSLSGRLRKRQHTIDGDHVFLLKWRQGG
jgi:hypothetical protein